MHIINVYAIDKIQKIYVSELCMYSMINRKL